MTVSCYGKGALEPKAQTAGAYHGFICVNKSEAMLKSITISPAVCCRYPLIHLGEERQWSKAACLRKQRDGRGSNPGPPDPELKVLTVRPYTTYDVCRYRY